jgi:site-specific DNA-methyltransferase (adenine-specific)
MECLISLVTQEGAIVLDPFAGSGTTCLAAKKLSRHYIGIEIDSDYVQTAKKRIFEDIAQLSLNIAEG